MKKRGEKKKELFDDLALIKLEYSCENSYMKQKENTLSLLNENIMHMKQKPYVRNESVLMRLADKLDY
jgi:hypothetical protein